MVILMSIELASILGWSELRWGRAKGKEKGLGEKKGKVNLVLMLS